MADRNNREVTFEIHEHVAVLSEGKDGWKREVTITSWNGGPAKLDIRSWSPDYEKMTRGLAFENVCLNHIAQIKSALGISGVKTNQSFLSVKPDDKDGTQIDLIIERKDNVVNMCEMKYYNKEFASNKKFHNTIVNRRELLEESIQKGMVVHSTLITTYGLKYNEYSGDFDSVITMEELFR